MLNYILNKKPTQEYVMNFVGQQILNNQTMSISLSIDPIMNIVNIKSYTDVIENETKIQYVKKYFKYKNDKEWSESLPINMLSGLTLCSTKTLELELFYYRIDENGFNNNSTDITIKNIQISGDYEFSITDSVAVLTDDNNQMIIEPKDIYKVFRLDNFEIISKGVIGNNLNVKFRFTQDNGYIWSNWENLTKENISTVKWNKLRFVKFQYLCEKNTDSSSAIKIYDIILSGDFQNVSANSLKTNKYGLKEECLTKFLKLDNQNYLLQMNYDTNGLSCYNNSNSIDNLMKNQSTDTLYKPYKFEEITKLNNFLATNMNNMFGHTVEYHRTAIDTNGEDYIIHEFQLFNIIAMKELKVIVPDNKFPDNQVVVNTFNLDLFETFKIQILKDEFKNTFGIESRPSSKDIIYFCQINRMFYIKHSQIHRDVMNSGIYYDVILEKYETKPNIQNKVEESINRIKELTDNSTVENLFGDKQYNEEKKIANKKQTKPRSFDMIRLNINSRTKLLEQSLVINNINIIESCYNFSNIKNTELGVEYIKADNNLKKSDNRTFINWFKIDNLYSENSAINKKVLDSYDVSNDNFNLLDNYESGYGYKIWYQEDNLWFMLNNKGYKLPVELMTNVWYCSVIELNQRQETIKMKLIRQDSNITVTLFNLKTYEKLELDIETDLVDIQYEMQNNGFRAVNNTEGPSNGFKVIHETEQLLDVDEFIIDRNVGILGSNINMTNIRIFNDVIADDKLYNVLLENIVTDVEFLLVADNANKKIYTTNYKNKNWK